jgi:hypothetical protein
MKHINDILNESILDKDLEDKVDEQIIRNWITKHCGENVGKRMSFDKDGRIVFPEKAWVRFVIDDKIPEFIKIASCSEMGIIFHMNGDVVIPEEFLPKSLDRLEIRIEAESESTLDFQTNILNTTDFVLSGSVTGLILPKKFTCNELDISSAGHIIDIKNINTSKIKKVNFPNKFGANLIRKYLKFQGEIRMNGFGPY